MTIGQILALVGVGIAVILSGMGSSKGVGLAGETAAGVSSENPEVSSKLLVLQLLPATQGIYGFLVGIIVLINTGSGAGHRLYHRLPAHRRGRLLLRHPSGARGFRRHADDRSASRNVR